MLLTRRSVTLGTVAGAAAAALAPDALSATALGATGSSTDDSQVVLDWERITFRTVYTDTLTPVPVGVPVLGFVAVAVHRAAVESAHVGASSEAAAVATAAHDVLVHYYPTLAAQLAADLANSLTGIGRARRAKGTRIGAGAAAALIASRAGDHYLDSSLHYSKAPGPGVWQPNPGFTDMLAPWLGSLRPLFLSTPVPVSGPHGLASSAYATEYDEVRRLGSSSSAERTPTQTDTAIFWNSNSATTVSDALVRYLEDQPLDLLATARLFAMIHGAQTDSAIRCWGLQAGRRLLASEPGRRRRRNGRQRRDRVGGGLGTLVPNPNYSDYVSGHACLTGPAVEVIRRILGENTPLEIRSVNTPTPGPTRT